MAEILGVVSSVIAIVGVAGKLGAGAVKLKKLWDQVQDVPTSIQFCLEELSLLAAELVETEEAVQQTHSMVQKDAAGRRSLDHCRKAMEELENMAKDIQKQIEVAKRGKRTIAMIKARLRQSVLEEHQRRLDITLRHVSTCLQLYHM